MLDKYLEEKLDAARSAGKRVGLVQGSWDLFHIGHLRYIKKAKKLCDFLIIGMDSDEKIRKRKGNNRPIIPEEERYNFIDELGIADGIVIKSVNEPKWGLIRSVKPDVLVTIRETYTDEEISRLEEICGVVVTLPRQSKSSTSDKIRTITISNQKNKIAKLEERVANQIEELKARIDYSDDMEEPIPELIKYISNSTDWVTPVGAGYHHNGKWCFGANQADFSIPKLDVEQRSELFYATVEHAEINLLKKLDGIEKLEGPIWVTLFPCDKCMKVLIDKGVKEIYYLEDHPDKNWSKRSHELARKNDVDTICVLDKRRRR